MISKEFKIAYKNFNKANTSLDYELSEDSSFEGVMTEYAPEVLREVFQLIKKYRSNKKQKHFCSFFWNHCHHCNAGHHKNLSYHFLLQIVFPWILSVKIILRADQHFLSEKIHFPSSIRPLLSISFQKSRSNPKKML